VNRVKLPGGRSIYNFFVNAATDDSELPYGASNPIATLAPARERLITTLFLAALFHGVLILGVTFGAPINPFKGTPSLEVILLSDQRNDDGLNPDAAYLAQRNQKGSGTTDEIVRPSSAAASPLPAYLAGIADGNGVDWQRALTGSPSVDIVTSRSRKSDPLNRHGEKQASQAEETPMALFYAPPSLVIDASIDKSLALRGPIVHEVEVSPNTREARVAPYLDSWRRKVERLGTIKYPMAARNRDMTGNPVLEVIIRADGSVAQIVIRRSSGHKELDQAAIGILKLASPFDPFPDNIRQDFDQLRFAYEWQFIGERMVGSITMSPDAATAPTP
jgi:periplasmic protein TonB